MDDDLLLLNTRPEKVVLWEVNEHFYFVPVLLKPTGQFDDLTLSPARPEMIND